MSRALAFSITASDRAAKVIENLNKRVNQLTRPIQNVQRSLQRFARAAGFDTVKQKLRAISETAKGIVRSFDRIGAPLLALIGGGTIAGMVALTEGWGRFGLQVTQTAQILGQGAQEIYNFRSAAQLLGLSGDAATQSLGAFADTLQDARWGRNQQAMGLLIGLGIKLRTTRAGSLDTMDALGQVADKIHAFQQAGNTGAARTLASQLGLTYLLPVLMQGRQALEDYQTQAQKLAGTQDWKQAAKAAMQWNRMRVAMEGAKNTIATALLPTITPLITQFGAWISANRTLIATNVSDFLKGLGAAFRGLTLKEVLNDTLSLVQGLVRLATGAAHVVTKLGGMKTVLEGLAVLWGASKVLEFGYAFFKIAGWVNEARKALIAYRAVQAGSAVAGAASAGDAAAGATARGVLPKILAGTSGAGLLAATGIGLLGGAAFYGGAKLWEHHELSKLNRNRIVAAPMAPSIMGFFQRQGWTAAQAAGITANIQAESGYDPQAVGDHGRARGIGQWHPDRQANFNAWAQQNKLPDLKHANLLEQLQFYDYELRRSDAGRRLASAQNANDAGAIVSLYDERPADAAGEAARRGALASQIAASAPAQVNVTVQTSVQKDGAVKTRVQTPSGVKIVHTNPADSVS